MYLEEIKLEDIKSWDSPGVFSSYDWLSIYPSQHLKIIGIFDDGKKLQGYFFHYLGKQLKVISHVKIPPYTPHNGLVVKDTTQNKANKLSFQKKLMTLIAEYYNKSRAGIITLAFPDQYTDMQAFTWHDFKVVPNYTYLVNLQQTEAELLNNISSKTRNLIKKAEKDGLTIECTTNYSYIEEIVKKSMQRNKVSADFALIHKILFTYANPQNSFSFVVRDKNNVVSSTFCIFDNHRCYYLLGGYDEANAHPGAGPLAVWNSMIEAKKRGLVIFDFEGSMIPPIESYFRSFGGDLTPYFTINKGKLVNELLLKFKKRGQF